MFKLVLEKAEEPEIKLPTCAGSWKKQEIIKSALYDMKSDEFSANASCFQTNADEIKMIIQFYGLLLDLVGTWVTIR